MTYEKRDNSGILFKNDKKESPKHPDYKGNALIGGKEHWLSAWVKDGKNGKFMSVSLTPKGENKPRQETPNTKADDFSDDIPF